MCKTLCEYLLATLSTTYILSGLTTNVHLEVITEEGGFEHYMFSTPFG